MDAKLVGDVTDRIVPALVAFAQKAKDALHANRPDDARAAQHRDQLVGGDGNGRDAGRQVQFGAQGDVDLAGVQRSNQLVVQRVAHRERHIGVQALPLRQRRRQQVHGRGQGRQPQAACLAGQRLVHVAHALVKTVEQPGHLRLQCRAGRSQRHMVGAALQQSHVQQPLQVAYGG